jgi:hypothetical protein
MKSAVHQAITTELTISEIKGNVSTPPWDNFYNMVLSTAKLLDNASPKPKEQQCQANAAQKIREAVVTVSRKMVVVVLEGVVAAITMVRIAAQGRLSDTPQILFPK